MIIFNITIVIETYNGMIIINHMLYIKHKALTFSVLSLFTSIFAKL